MTTQRTPRTTTYIFEGGSREIRIFARYRPRAGPTREYQPQTESRQPTQYAFAFAPCTRATDTYDGPQIVENILNRKK